MRSFIVIILLFPLSVFGQELTGKWIGKISTQEYLELNIQPDKKYYKGYSYDHDYADSNNFCKAAFYAEFNKKKKQLYVDGIDFIARADTLLFPHVLMTMFLQYKQEGDNEFLEGVLYKQGEQGPSSPDSVWLMRNISGKTEPRVQPEIVKPKKTEEVNKVFRGRENVLLKTIHVNTRNIRIKLIDNEVYDADTVSVFVNNKALLLKQEINYEPLELNIEIPKNENSIELGFFADNLGRIPPNTALLIIIAGKETYQLKAVADYTKNAIVEIIFDPE